MMSEIQFKNGNGRFSEAVIHNGIIYTSGIVGDTPGADASLQTKEILAHFDRILAENHSDRKHILDLTVIIPDIRKNGNVVGDIINAWGNQDALPARFTYQGLLVSPLWNVEISMRAAQK